MDELGPLDIEFVINTDMVNAQAKQVQATLESVTAAVQASAAQASSGIEATIQQLEAQLLQLETAKAAAINPSTAKVIDNQMQNIGNTLTRLYAQADGAAAPFANIGNAVEAAVPKVSKFEAAIDRVTNVSNIGARVVTQFSRQIISLGVGLLSGIIGAKAIEALVSYFEKLSEASDKLNQMKQNQLALNEVMADANKSAGAQITNLNALYEAATDVTLSIKDRTAAAQELKKEFPEAFANSSTMAILNGQEKQSFDDLTASILKNAQAMAAKKKVEDLESKLLDVQYQFDKNNYAKVHQLAAVKGPTSGADQSQSNYGGYASMSSTISVDEQKKDIEHVTDMANAGLVAQKKVLQGQIDFLTQYVGGANAIAKTLENTNKLIQDPLTNFSIIVQNASDKSDLENLRTALQSKLDALAPNDGQIAVYRAKIQQVDDLIKKDYSVKPTSANDPAKAILASQTSLQEKIQALKTEYQAKDATRDEQEIAAVKAKYQTIYNDIVAQNVKYTDYLKTHSAAQATAKGLVYIDPASINTDEANAEAGVRGAQALEKTKQTIEAQKALFTDYEAFKVKAGSAAADDMYADQLHGFKTYIDYLKGQEPTEAELTSSDPATKSAASQKADYLKGELAKAQTERLTQNAKVLQELIEQNQDYEEKRATLVQKAADQIKILTEAGYIEQAAVVQGSLQAQLALQDDAQAEKVQSMKDFATKMLDLTKSQALLQIKTAKDQNDANLASGVISVETFQKIAAAIQQASDAVKSDTLLTDLNDIGKALTALGPDIEKVNPNLGAFASVIGSTLTSVTALSKLADTISHDGGFLTDLFSDDPSAAFGVITAGLQGILSLVNTLESAAAQRKQAAADYYNSIIAFQNQYQLALIQQQETQYQLDGNIFFTNYAQQMADAAKALSAANTAYQASLTALSAGQAIVGTKNVLNGKNIASSAGSGALTGAAIGSVVPVIGTLAGAAVGGIVGAIAGIFGGKTKTSVLAPLLATYPALIQTATDGTVTFNEALAKTLIANNQVSASTKVLLQNTIDLNDARTAAIASMDDALKSLTGDLGTNLENALVTAFENGTDAAQAFGKAVSDVISNIVSQLLFEAVFQKQLDDLQTSLQNTVEAGGSQDTVTSGLVTDINAFLKGASASTTEYDAALTAYQKAEAAQGVQILQPSDATGASSSNTLTGQISGITAQQADLLAGQFGGLRLTQLETNQILTTNMAAGLAEMKNQTLVQMQIAADMKRTADNTDTMVTDLKTVAKNTSSTNLTNALRAAGV